MLKIVCGAVIIGAAMLLYVISTSLANKDKAKDGQEGCTGGCSGCGNTGCAARRED